MAEDSQLYFRGTCDVFELKTCIDVSTRGQRFIDPCDCYKYYQCNNYEMLHQTCADGTAWDADTMNCIHYKDVIFYQNCSATNVWTRCNVTESRMTELELFCTKSTTTTSTMTPSSQPTQSSNKTTSGKTSPGIIVGSLIGGALLAVIILIAVFCLYKRRKQKNSIDKKRGGTFANNPEYFEGGVPDDPYAIINDSHLTQYAQMNDPTYNGSTLEGTLSQQNGVFTNTGLDGTDGETVYDNSGALIVGDGGYTSTLRRSDREYETPSRVQSSSENIECGEMRTGEMSSSRTDLNGNQEKTDELAMAKSHSDGKHKDNVPDYFILAKEDDHM